MRPFLPILFLFFVSTSTNNILFAKETDVSVALKEPNKKIPESQQTFENISTPAVNDRFEPKAIKKEDPSETSRSKSEFQELLTQLQSKSPLEIFNKANSAFKDGEYLAAIETYRVLNSLYPFNEYAEQARVYSIKANYRNDLMDRAIKEISHFALLYPTSKYLEAVYYLQAKAYFYYRFNSTLRSTGKYFSMNFAERLEMDHLIASAKQFEQFLKRFSNGAYKEKAEKKLQQIHQLIVTKEYHIARFYFKKEDYLAAYNRIVDLLKRYPDAMDRLSKKHADRLSKNYHYIKEQLGLTA